MNLNPSHKNKKILIIDDEKSFRDSIRFYLEDCDFDVYEAENGKLGVERILTLKPDLVLIDLYMPEMTGLDVLQWVAEHVSDQPIIVISGAGVMNDVAEALRRGAWDYLFKPIEDLTVLQYSVNKALERAAFITANKNYQSDLESEVIKRTSELQKANTELQNHYNKIIKSTVEEKLLSSLMQNTIEANNEVNFLSQAIKIITQALSKLHQINQGVVYQIREKDPKEYQIVENLSSRNNHYLTSEPFFNHLRTKLQQSAATSLKPQTFADDCFIVLPVQFKSKNYALFVLFLSIDKGSEQDNSNFMQRINDILNMGIAKIISEHKINYLAHHDALTGLANRNTLLDSLYNTQQLIHRHHWNGILLFIDLDRFKKLNDSLGHIIGDELLVQVADRLRSLVREEDLVARLGGDEFVILMMIQKNNKKDVIYDTKQIASKIISALSIHYSLKGYDYYLTCSIGICIFNNKKETASDLLKHADTAMFRAKAEGGSCSHFYLPEMQQAADARLRIEKDLHIGIEDSQFEIYYQAQLDIRSGDIIGAEALVRWNHPVRGLISPMEFIPVAEETGIILDLGRLIFIDVVQQIGLWEKNKLIKTTDSFAINICPQQFQRAEFVDSIVSIMKTTKINPKLLKLEITESTLINNVDEMIKKMNQLKQLGFSFSMDDFGTGYSSLSYLKRLPLDQLKIDQSFVSDIANDENDAAIIETIIAMGKHLGMNVIAEGVETESVLELLKQKGCESYQGYLFSKPIPAKDFEALLKQHRQ